MNQPPTIRLTRLTQVPLPAVLELLNEPRNTRHMPLSTAFTAETAAAWVAAKDGQWDLNGYGPWAVVVDDQFAGWCGFQREDNGADFALVLHPAHWGRGAAIARLALPRGFDELGLSEILIALPSTRNPARAVARFGFVPAGTVSYGGITFEQFRLTRDAWLSSREK